MDVAVEDIYPTALGYLYAPASARTDLRILYGYICGSGNGYAIAGLGCDFQVLKCLSVVGACNQ
jgi:hypothetical protein